MPELTPIIAYAKDNIQNDCGCDYNINSNYPVLHSHDFFEVTFFFARTKHLLNGRTSWIEEDTLFFFRPSDTHCFTDCSVSLGHINIKISQECMHAICDYLDEDLYQALLTADDARLAIPMSREFGRDVRKHLDDLLSAHSAKQVAIFCKLLIVSFLKQLYFHLYSEVQMPESETVNSILLLLQNPKNFSTNITELLSGLGYSYMHIYRLFKDATGQTPNGYFAERKLQYAANLLTYTNYKIVEIASLCGFATQARFDTIFKKRFHISPREYRRTRPQQF